MNKVKLEVNLAGSKNFELKKLKKFTKSKKLKIVENLNVEISKCKNY